MKKAKKLLIFLLAMLIAAAGTAPAAAGSEGKHHDHSKDKCKDFFHFVCSFLWLKFVLCRFVPAILFAIFCLWYSAEKRHVYIKCQKTSKVLHGFEKIFYFFKKTFSVWTHNTDYEWIRFCKDMNAKLILRFFLLG